MQKSRYTDATVMRSPRHRRWIAPPLLVAVLIAVAECTVGSPDGTGSASSSPSPSDKVHVAYELSVLNYHPYPAVITSVKTVTSDGAVVTSLSRAEVQALTLVLPSLSIAGAPDTGIPAGATAVLILEDVYPDRASVPDSVTHQISASFAPTDAGPDPRASQFPTTVTETGGPVMTSPEEPVALGAPVAGAGWLMNNGCCDVLNYHRNVILPLNGTLHAGERYGIDFEQLQPGLAPGPMSATDLRLRSGTDGTNVQDFYAYGAPLLAVADGTVVKVVSDIPDTALGYTGAGGGVTLNNAGGNTVILQLAPDRFAVYFHNAPDSTLVKVGNRVTKGQTIAPRQFGQFDGSPPALPAHSRAAAVLEREPAVRVRAVRRQGKGDRYRLDRRTRAGAAHG